MYQSEVKDENVLTDLISEQVCPFSNSAKNENYISESLYNTSKQIIKND